MMVRLEGTRSMKRHEENPILIREDIPSIAPHLVDVSSVFNPGAVMFNGEHVLLLRVQNRGRETFTMVARSRDGVRFTVEPRAVEWQGLDALGGRIHHAYDPRITPIEGRFLITLALDMEHGGRAGCWLALAETRDFKKFSVRGLISERESRNGVLFPEKVGGRYLLLERPNTVGVESGPGSGEEIWLSSSPDLRVWKRETPVMKGRWHYWDERIGSGPPPLKTPEGWLHLYHGVATHFTAGIYQAGVVLLDLEDPSRVLARSRYNVLEPRELYECVGQVPNVTFPSGWIPEKIGEDGMIGLDTRLHIYYGCADTCTGLAVTTAGALIEAART